MKRQGAFKKERGQPCRRVNRSKFWETRGQGCPRSSGDILERTLGEEPVPKWGKHPIHFLKMVVIDWLLLPGSNFQFSPGQWHRHDVRPSQPGNSAGGRGQRDIRLKRRDCVDEYHQHYRRHRPGWNRTVGDHQRKRSGAAFECWKQCGVHCD